MRSILRDRLFKKHYDKLFSTKSDKSTKSTNTFSSVTILAPAKYTDNKDLRATRVYFDKMQISLHIYLLREKGDHIGELDRVSVISREECEWYDVPTQDILIQWLANKTDLLIMHDPELLPIMRYLCAASNSKLKSALTNPKLSEDDYDINLWIDLGKDSRTLLSQSQHTYRTLGNLGIGPPVIG